VSQAADAEAASAAAASDDAGAVGDEKS